jgi:hypothetical protein
VVRLGGDVSPSARAVHLYRLATRPGGVERERAMVDLDLDERGMRRLLERLRTVPGVVIVATSPHVVVREAA